jgi:hypothetical protein
MAERRGNKGHVCVNRQYAFLAGIATYNMMQNILILSEERT